MYQNLPQISKKKSSAYLIDIYVLFDHIREAELKNEMKTGTGSSFPRHFGEKRHFWMIRLCSATTRSADRLVYRRRFGPPLWTRNWTAIRSGEPTPITLSVT